MSKDTLTLGSLFSGSGGFELAGLLAGIKPIWNCEVEPFPIMVTTKRLPDVKHYGDISALNGAELEAVDIITGGFPCQSVSVAGKRAGVKHVEHGGDETTRSGLFYEATRIIKEMRKATNGKYPRYFVVENVPGLFSSNKGEDFRQVLEEIIGIVEPEAQMPAPDQKGWPNADYYMGDGWSLAYRVLNAQGWGLPQRRARIFLVADFTGGRAAEILFESEGLSGYSAESFRAWQRAARYPEKGIGAASGADEGLVLCDQGGCRMDVLKGITATLRAEAHHPPVVMEAAGFCTEHSGKSRSIGYEDETSPTLRAGVVPAALSVENYPTDSRIRISEDGTVQTLTSRMGQGGNNTPLVMEPSENSEAKVYGVCSNGSNAMKSDNPHSGFYEADSTRTLDCNGGNPLAAQGGMVVVCVDQGGGKSSVNISEELAPTLATSHGGEPVIAFAQNQRQEVRDLHDKAGALAVDPGIHQQTFVLQGSMIGRADKNGPQGSGINEDVCFTIDTCDRHAVAYGIGRDAFNQGQNALYKPAIEEELQPTLVAKGPGAVAEPTWSASKASFFTMASEEVANTLVASDYKDPPIVNDEDDDGIRYIVRRLTPVECLRLQGLADWWCDGLGTENPTEEEIAFWTDVFETHRKVITHADKPKSEKQIIKWLKDPYSDSAAYKMAGNGIAVPCAYFVLSGIVWADGLEDENEDSDH